MGAEVGVKKTAVIVGEVVLHVKKRDNEQMKQLFRTAMNETINTLYIVDYFDVKKGCNKPFCE